MTILTGSGMNDLSFFVVPVLFYDLQIESSSSSPCFSSCRTISCSSSCFRIMTSLSPVRWSGYESSESYSDATTEPEPAAVLSEPGKT